MEVTNGFAQQAGAISTHQHIRVPIVVSNSGANSREDLVDATMQNTCGRWFGVGSDANREGVGGVSLVGEKFETDIIYRLTSNRPTSCSFLRSANNHYYGNLATHDG